MTSNFLNLELCNFIISDALASDEDEIDEEGQQYLEKLEKSVSVTKNALSYDVAAIQWIASCHKNRMTTCVITLGTYT